MQPNLEVEKSYVAIKREKLAFYQKWDRLNEKLILKQSE
jgi:hypothetical protein